MTFVFRGIPKSLVDLGADALAGVDVGRVGLICGLWRVKKVPLLLMPLEPTDLVKTDAFLERLVSC